MGRPRKDVRFRRDNRSGKYLVMFRELGKWIMSPAETESRAQAWANRHRDKLLAITSSTLNFKSFAENFFTPDSPWVKLQRDKGRTFGEKYLQVRDGHVRNYLVPLFGKVDPRALTAGQIEAGILGAKKESGRALAPATKYKIMYTLGVILDYLCVKGILDRNPIDNLEPYSKAPIAPRSAIPRDAFPKLFPETHGGLVKVWRSSMWAAMMCLFRDTGLRPGEVRALKWRELYLDDRIVPIRHGIAAGTVDTVKTTKNDLTKAGILTLRTVQELTIWRAESKHSGPDDWIFTVDGDAPVAGASIVKAFRRGLKDLELTQAWTPYWLRHSFITYNMESLDDSELLMLAGHTNLATNTIYRHPDDVTVIRRAQPIREKLDRERG